MLVRRLNLISLLRVVFAARSLALHCKSCHVLVTAAFATSLRFLYDAYIPSVRLVSTSNFCEPKILSCLHTFCEACSSNILRGKLFTACTHFARHVSTNILREDTSLFAHLLQRLLQQSFRILILLNRARWTWYVTSNLLAFANVKCLPYGGRYLNSSWGRKHCRLTCLLLLRLKQHIK